MKELLEEALNALNQIKNTRYTGKYKDTYELCSKIEEFFRKEEESLDLHSSKMFTQLKFPYAQKENK